MSHRLVTSLFHFVIAVCSLVVLTSAHASDGKPAAMLEADMYDFGEVFEGTDVTHDFIIQNTGDADLEIQKVKAG